MQAVSHLQQQHVPFPLAGHQQVWSLYFAVLWGNTWDIITWDYKQVDVHEELLEG